MVILRPSYVVSLPLKQVGYTYANELANNVDENFNNVQRAVETLTSENQYLRAVISIIADKINLCEDCPDRYKQLAGECQYCGHLDSIVKARYGI